MGSLRHYIEAYCIAENVQVEKLSHFWYLKQVRKHNRQIHRLTINKGGTRKRNQTLFEIFGYRLFDKVKCKGKVGFIFGRRALDVEQTEVLIYDGLTEQK